MTMENQRSCIYVACEEVDMIWDERDVTAFDSMWNEGFSIDDIASSFERDVDEVALLVMDRARNGYISKRKNAFRGKENTN